MLCSLTRLRVVLLVLFSSLLLAQRDLGTITGPVTEAVTDPQGAALPSAKVTITDTTGLTCLKSGAN